MTKPRTPEEITYDAWVAVHTPGNLSREVIFAALREAADAARREEQEKWLAEVERLRSLLEANIPPRTYGSLQEEVDFLRRDVASLQANKHNLITRLAAERARSRAEEQR